MRADSRRALGPEPALLRAVADLFQDLPDEIHIAECAQPGLHQHPDHGPRFYGVYAQVVDNGVQPGEIVRFLDAAV